MKTNIEIIEVHSKKKDKDYPMLQITFGEENPYVVRFFITAEQKYIIENMAR